MSGVFDQKRVPLRSQDNVSGGMVRSTLFTMIGLMLAKVTGFVRELLVVPILGLGTNSDGYLLGFQIPDLFYQLLIGGAVAAALTPSIATALERREEKKIWHSVSVFVSFVFLLMCGFVLIGEIFAPQLIRAYNPRAAEQTLQIATRVTRMLFPQTVFMMLAGICNGILYAYKKFKLTSFASTLYNTSVIFFMILLGNDSVDGPVRVAFGVVLSALIFFLYQYLISRREWRQFRPSLDLRDSGFRRMIHLAIPTLISGSIVRLNEMVLTFFVGIFGVGTLTALYQAGVTWSLPYGIFTIAIGIVMLPNLTKLVTQRDYKGMRALYTSSLRNALFMVTPFALFFFLMSFDTIQTIFVWKAGSYPEANIQLSADILRFYCIAIIAQTVVYLTNQAFYSRRITRLTLLTGVISFVLNPLFSYLFTRVIKMGPPGLSFSYALTSCVSAFVLFSLYRLHIPQARPYRMLPFVFRLLICCLISGFVVYAFSLLPLNPERKLMQLAWYVARLTLGMLTFYLTGLAIRLREATTLSKQLKRILGFS